MAAEQELIERIRQVGRRVAEVRRQVGQVLMGQERALELLLVALLSGGHVLIEDLPGTGKTTLAKALARCLDLSFSRIQFTPDLMPSDVTGYNYFDQKGQEFRFRPGPLLAQVVLADEINRAIPRTQAALLEAMGEGQVTVDGVTITLPRPFFLVATQNPVELEGTFPLPEAQLDRFLLSLSLGYPSLKEEEEMLLAHAGQDPLQLLRPVWGADELAEAMNLVQAVHVAPSLRSYLLQLVRATRSRPGLAMGGSPRATLGLYRAARALALLRGRAYVLPDDIKELAVPVLAHRLLLDKQAMIRGRRPQEVVTALLEEVPLPLEEEGYNAAGRR